MDRSDYWQESFELTLEAMGFQQFVDQLTPEQRQEIGESLAVSAENESIAFYSPPVSDRLSSIDRDWQIKYDTLKSEYQNYQTRVDQAIVGALRLKGTPRDYDINIDQFGNLSIIRR